MVRWSVPCILFLLSVVTISFITIDLNGEHLGASPDQIVDIVLIEIREESISIDVSVDGNATGILHWTATLTLQIGIIVESVTVHMTPDHSTDVSVGLSIYDFSLTPSDPVMVGTANITAAPGTSTSASPIIVLGATAKVQPRGTNAGVTDDSAEIVILPFFSAEAHFSETVVNMKVGERRTFVLEIENRGNSAGDFKVAVVNSQELMDKGVEVSISEQTVNIGEGSKRKVDIIIKVKDGAKVGGHSLQVKVTPSEVRSGNVEGSALLTLDVREAYMSTVQDLLSEPFYLLATFALVMIFLGLAVFLGLKLRTHLAWRRTLKRIRSSDHHKEGGPKGH